MQASRRRNRSKLHPLCSAKRALRGPLSASGCPPSRELRRDCERGSAGICRFSGSMLRSSSSSTISIARREDRDSICCWRCSCHKPRLLCDDGRTGGVRADADSASSGFAPQKVEHAPQSGSRKRRVEIEDRAPGQIRCSRILLDERNSIQVQPLCALPRAFHVACLRLDPYDGSAGTHRDE
jgi:hypothetical protein